MVKATSVVNKSQDLGFVQADRAATVKGSFLSREGNAREGSGDV